MLSLDNTNKMLYNQIVKMVAPDPRKAKRKEKRK